MDVRSPDEKLRDAGGRTEGALLSPADDRPTTADNDSKQIEPLIPTRMADLGFSAPPPREWIVEDWLGIGHVTGQYGEGGAGKGIIAQCLQTAAAADKPWLGRIVQQCPSLALYCEDDIDELHRRQERICAALGASYGDLDDMFLVSGAGEDNTFATFSADGRMLVTDRFWRFRETALKHNARLIVLDNVADLYGGSENDRNQVRRFVGLLTGLAMEANAAVLLNCHPSRSGMKSGDLDGGSTAWSNSMRGRWTLAKAKDDDGLADDGECILRRAKANYAPDGGIIRLRWVGGVLMPVDGTGGISGAPARAHVEAVFLALLDRCGSQGQRLSESKNAPNYAPKIMGRRPDREGYTQRDFERALMSLFADCRIRVIEYSNKGKLCRHIVRDERGSTSEDDNQH